MQMRCKAKNDSASGRSGSESGYEFANFAPVLSLSRAGRQLLKSWLGREHPIGQDMSAHIDGLNTLRRKMLSMQVDETNLLGSEENDLRECLLQNGSTQALKLRI